MKLGVLANAVTFQGNWFVVILGAAAGHPWAGVVSSAAFILGYAAITGRWSGVLRLAALSGLIGYAADSTLVLAGLLGFPEDAAVGAPSTVWMIALWGAIACTLNSCMGWLQGRPGLAALFGFLGGAGSYFAGQKLGAVTFPAGPVAGAIAAGVLWLVAMPLLAWLAGRVDPVAGGGRRGGAAGGAAPTATDAPPAGDPAT